MVNRLGPSFAFRMMDEAGASIEEVVRNYKIACEIFNVNAIWGALEALDNVVSTDIQIEMLMKVRKLVERTMFWLHSNRSHVTSIDEIVSEFSTSIISMSKQMLSFAPDAKQGSIKNSQAE